MKYFLLTFAFLLVAACAKQPRSTQLSSSQPPSCPRAFVAQPFAQLILTTELRNTRHTLSFVKVQALCEENKKGAMFLNLSFTLQLDKPFVATQRQKPLLLPLFAVLTQDGKTITSRRSQRLRTTFDKKGRTQSSWLLAFPPAFFSSSEIISSSTLYLGFEGEEISVRQLRPQP